MCIRDSKFYPECYGFIQLVQRFVLICFSYSCYYLRLQFNKCGNVTCRFQDDTDLKWFMIQGFRNNTLSILNSKKYKIFTCWQVSWILYFQYILKKKLNTFSVAYFIHRAVVSYHIQEYITVLQYYTANLGSVNRTNGKHF